MYMLLYSLFLYISFKCFFPKFIRPLLNRPASQIFNHILGRDPKCSPTTQILRLHIHSQTVESQPLQYGRPALCSISTKNRSQLSEQAIKRIKDKVSYTRGSTGENRQRVRVIEAWCCLLSEPSERMDGPATQREDW